MDNKMTLEELLEWSKGYEMTPEEMEEQRRSFAYGNVKISNPAVTREMVDEIADLREKRENDRKR